MSIPEVIEAIAEAVPGAAIGFEDTPLPFPEDADAGSFAEVDAQVRADSPS